MRHITADDLPEDIARLAQAQVASGRFANVEDVIRAGIKVLEDQTLEAQTETPEWLEYARHEAAIGFAQLDRGEGIRGTPKELMDGIRKRVAELKDK